MSYWKQVWEQLFPSTHSVAATVAWFRTFRQSLFGSGAVVALMNIVVQPSQFSQVNWEMVGLSVLGAVIASVIAATNAWNDVLVHGPAKAYTDNVTETAADPAPSVPLFTVEGK